MLIIHYLKNLAIAVDQFANAVLLGDPDETLSSRMGKAIREGRCRLCQPICRLLDRIDPRPGHHCLMAIEDDEGADDLTRGGK